MEKIKQVWEYPTISEVVYNLIDKGMPEEKRHLIIGIGIFLGSRQAYKKQEEIEKGRYWENWGLAQEAGMIAEEIKKLSRSAPPQNLETLIKGMNLNGDTGDRLFGYIKSRRIYSQEDLKGLGKWVEELFCGPANKQEFWKFKKKFEQFKKELKEKIDAGDFTEEELHDPEALQSLANLAKEKPREYKKIKKKYDALSEYQVKVGKWLENENSLLGEWLGKESSKVYSYLLEYFERDNS